ncbi:MAG: amidohydrolase family protein [Gammaproteobacteria bacterium]|nr:amidohydrolase family protein [Gammaproteobacteria bacterium]
MQRISAILIIVLLAAACGEREVTTTAPGHYDVVLANGRVMDPESGLDAIRHVGITGDTIGAISDAPLAGTLVVDVSGQVVSPGFVNIHSHSFTPLGQEFELRDGVTTAIEAESGAYPVAAFGTHEPIDIAARARINFGASVGHAWVRSLLFDGERADAGFDQVIARAMRGPTDGGLASGTFSSPLPANRIGELREHLLNGLDEGGLGIGVLLDYMSEVVSEDELRTIFEVAGERQAPVFIHVRRGVAGDTSGLIEAIELAKDTRAPVHICHLQASAMQNVAEFLRLIRQAREDGLQITTESFPYNAGSTSITAAVFNRDWRKIFAIGYEDVEWAATGERFTEQMWNEYREKYPQGAVIHHYNREEWTSIATNAADVIVAADGVPILTLDAKVAPFGIGANARVLGRYVREKGSLDLMAALSKMTYQPAMVLARYSPAMAMKGRLRPGADADITVFDPQTIIDNATFQDPYQASTGISHVIVGGRFALRDGSIVEETFAGRRVLR